MAETAKGKSNSMDSPAKESGSKGNANSMPTKVYPSSTKMATAGPKTTIDGPCSAEGRTDAYHK